MSVELTNRSFNLKTLKNYHIRILKPEKKKKMDTSSLLRHFFETNKKKAKKFGKSFQKNIKEKSFFVSRRKNTFVRKRTNMSVNSPKKLKVKINKKLVEEENEKKQKENKMINKNLKRFLDTKQHFKKRTTHRFSFISQQRTHMTISDAPIKTKPKRKPTRKNHFFKERNNQNYCDFFKPRKIGTSHEQITDSYYSVDFNSSTIFLNKKEEFNKLRVDSLELLVDSSSYNTYWLKIADTLLYSEDLEDMKPGKLGYYIFNKKCANVDNDKLSPLDAFIQRLKHDVEDERQYCIFAKNFMNLEII